MCSRCGQVLPWTASGWSTTAIVLGSVVFAITIALAARNGARHRSADNARQEPACDPGSDRRSSWIDERNPGMDGYSPSTFGMRAVGECATGLGLREEDCSLRRLLAAYGSKPFMKEAKALGFTRIICRSDEFSIGEIVRR